MMSLELPQPLIELTRRGVANLSAERPKQCTVLIEENDVMMSRRIPDVLSGIIGFIEWNKFCDRIDEGLAPLRALAESQGNNNSEDIICHSKEQDAKTKALQSLQRTCDKLSKKIPALKLNLYCPFHTRLVTYWHIQIQVTDSSQDEAPTSGGQESQHAPTTTIHHQVSDSTNDEDNNNHDSEHGNGTNSTLESHDNPRPEGNHREAESSLPHSGATRRDHVNDTDTSIINQTTDSPCKYYSREGQGVLGVDYIEHTVLPTDTLGGLCLAYNVSATRLKQANFMSGDNDSLLLAPKILAIPISEGFYHRVQDTESKDFKLKAMAAEFPKLGRKEAQAYLELADWVLKDAIETAREDIAWEKEAKADDF